MKKWTGWKPIPREHPRAESSPSRVDAGGLAAGPQGNPTNRQLYPATPKKAFLQMPPKRNYFRLMGRNEGDASSVKTRISSSVTVQISWCKLNTLTLVQTRIMASNSFRATSINWPRSCLSSSVPFFRGCCSQMLLGDCKNAKHTHNQ